MTNRGNETTIEAHELEEPLETVDFNFSELLPSSISRRAFVQALGAGLLICVAGSTFAQTRPGAQERGGEPASARGRGGRRGGGFGGNRSVPLEARLHIAKNGKITVLSGKVEGGQGARTEITQAAAEELGVPIEQVTAILADTGLVPDDGPTVGSRTTPSTIPEIRRACAAAKKLLEEFISKSPVAKKLTYADLASSENVAELFKQTAPRDVTITAVKEWKILGLPTHRPGSRDLVTGAHSYPADVIVPGMLYGKILRPASYGATLTDINLEPAKQMEGVSVVRDGAFVAVAAPNTRTAKKALTALEATVQWDKPPHPSSRTLADYLRKNARDGVPGSPFKDEIAAAAKSMKATFYVPYVQHVPLEPRAAVAQWEGDKLTVWTSTQMPFGVRNELARAFNMPAEKIRVIVPDFGAAFGGKHTGECAVEAARLAKGAGKPVALRWTRQEEFTWAYFRPAAVIDLHATLDKAGTITSWFSADINYGSPGIKSPYRVKQEVADVPSKPPLRHGSYRALAATANNFARESFMDELAHGAGKNPLEFRLAHLEDGRLRDVLEKAAKEFDFVNKWSATRDDNVGVGLACATEKGSFVAACAHVTITDRAKGTIRIDHVCQAFDCGAIMNPDGLMAQVQGAIIQAIGPALREESTFEDGKITNASLHTYGVPRFSDLPKLDVHLVNRPDQESAGAGETPLIVLAPAVANAIFSATNLRLRQMPLRLPIAT
jgi:isoquinoline 1-oxidoreductase